ncbi:MAG: hypothetical protein JW793_08980 [Acidobacteria bacterium]|nr:hypothetical protein [Acidobacteriota bacterium]
MKTTRYNLLLPEDLHRRFKIVCVQEGKDMSEVVREMIEGYVVKAEKKQKK